MHVVAVEDQYLILMLLQDIIEDCGHTVELFTSGEDALEYMRSGNHFDVLITDLDMPIMTGQVLAAHVRGMFPELPVVYVSGGIALASEELSGPFYKIPKPFSIGEFSTLFAKLAPSRAA